LNGKQARDSPNIGFFAGLLKLGLKQCEFCFRLPRALPSGPFPHRHQRRLAAAFSTSRSLAPLRLRDDASFELFPEFCQILLDQFYFLVERSLLQSKGCMNGDEMAVSFLPSPIRFCWLNVTSDSIRKFSRCARIDDGLLVLPFA
jgi:hypothetical protein